MTVNTGLSAGVRGVLAGLGWGGNISVGVTLGLLLTDTVLSDLRRVHLPAALTPDVPDGVGPVWQLKAGATLVFILRARDLVAHPASPGVIASVLHVQPALHLVCVGELGQIIVHVLTVTGPPAG